MSIKDEDGGVYQTIGKRLSTQQNNIYSQEESVDMLHTGDYANILDLNQAK